MPLAGIHARPEPPAGRRGTVHFLFHRWPGRLLLAGLAVVALEWSGLAVPDAVAVLGRILVAVFGAWALLRLGRHWARRLLWRIRTKLILSYLFIAVVPVVLLNLFFLLAGVLGVSLVTSYVVTSHVERSAQELKTLARTSVMAFGIESDHVARLEQLRRLYPGLSWALVRQGQAVSVQGDMPGQRPAWLRERGFAGVVRSNGVLHLRGLWTEGPLTLALDRPLGQTDFAEIERHTGIVVFGGGEGRKEKSVSIEVGGGAPADPARTDGQAPAGVNSVAVIPVVRWDTGELELEPLGLRVSPATLVDKLSPSVEAPRLLVTVLTLVAITFLVLYSMALGLGLLLARSITRGIHALSLGTERLRQGDFARPIPTHTRDQLGDLAESFNVMARGMEDLLRESAERQRLEEELRIARQIQMSLLPQAAVGLPGLRVAAACLPATEVGGDYYDLLPLSETRLGVLVADVSGKGTSAALYMAELKGLVLSLSRIYDSPARLLAEANGILAANMDARSFITMTYAVVDTAGGFMRFARAGHNALIHLERGRATTRLLAPQGMGLGLDRSERFQEVLEEAEVPLRSGDIFLFFTDGLSEAMNSEAELFGEGRLRRLLEERAARDGQEDVASLRDRILAEVRGFVGGAPQHDDMTMVLLEVA